MHKAKNMMMLCGVFDRKSQLGCFDICSIIAYNLKMFFFCKVIANFFLLLLLGQVTFYNLSEAQNHFPQNDDPDVPWQITADEIEYDHNNNQYIAIGKVNIKKNKTNVSADLIRFDHKNMKAYAKGNVILTDGKDIISGTSLEMNLETELGTVYDGVIFFKETNFYIKGYKIHKVGINSYTAEKATISTCNGNNKAWRITGRNLKVTIEGYGSIKHATFWAKNIPAFYSPYLFFPVKQKRQSGLLKPEFHLSDRKGFEYIQPVYWAINDSSDATFYWHFMANRGNKLGVEYRYLLNSESKATIMYDYLHDKKIDDGTEDKVGYDDDNVNRLNSDRYWLRMKLNHALPFNFYAKLDLDIVSDQDYLREFKGGYTGFRKTDKYFLDNFGRDITAYDTTNRKNKLGINKTWSKGVLNADVVWYDNVLAKQDKQENGTLQKIPWINFQMPRLKMLMLPFYYNFVGEYIRFYREEGLKGHRADIYPTIFLPLQLKNYFVFEPSIGIRHTTWYLDKQKNVSIETEKFLNRDIYNIKLDISSRFFKIYHTNIKNIDRVKHTLTPNITYQYTPEKTQDNFPAFDGIDRIEKTSLLTYSITSTLTSRSKLKKNGNDKTAKHIPYKYSYNQFFRFKMQQSYDLNKAKEDDDPEPFLPILSEIEFSPHKYFALTSDAQWSMYTKDTLISYNVKADFWDQRDDKLFIEYRYMRDTSESINTSLWLKISEKISVDFGFEKNMFDGKMIKSNVGFLYNAQCWALGIRYTKEEDDQKYSFLVELHGL